MSLEGDQVNLTCSAMNDVDAIHSLQINWYKGSKLLTPNGKNIKLNSKSDNTSRQLNSTLQYGPVNRTDDGMYTCQAFNHNDSFSESKTNLTIQCTYSASVINSFSIITFAHFFRCSTCFHS